jgi:hypothetical protein
MTDGAIPFELFAGFRRIAEGNPVLAGELPEWAAATHGIVVDDTLHYIWARNRHDRWVLMHSTAPADRPWKIEHDPRNPILGPSDASWENKWSSIPSPS